MYNLTYLPRAEKALRKFPKGYQSLIIKKIDALKNNPKPRGYDKIAGKTPSLYKIRIGSYRAFYFIDEEAKEIIVADINRRTTQTYRH
jgi:mRNA-degrading endonuclease RelE of RelBE toxin-antitoxin system